MTTNTLRVTLNGADFPMLYRDAPRTAVLPGVDQVRYYGRGQENQDWNMPQLIYAENVMPIARGIISTAIVQLIDPAVLKVFDQAIILRDSEENNTLFVPSNGNNYLLNSTTGNWTSSIPFMFTHKLITRAYTQGRSFVGFEKEKILEYDGVNGVMIDRTGSIVFPTGFTIADIRGIGGASNYLLLFTDVDILWSSPNDPLNFDRSLNNGSGYQIPQDARGQLTCILPVAGGAIAYTVRNAVAMVYTNNAATPFLFRGITNCGGVASYEQVAYDADEQYQYVWGSGGMQAVSLQSAQSVFPEVSDFLTSGYFEYFDYTTNTVVGTNTGSFLFVKLTYVSQRFLVVSYGRTVGSYEFALVYDASLKRWGKVKVAHVDSFTYPYPNINGVLRYTDLTSSYFGLGSGSYLSLGVGVTSISPPKRSIAFLASDGSISILAVDYSSRIQKGVAIFGTIQLTREKYTTLHKVEVEGFDTDADNSLQVLCCANGKDVSRVVEFLTYEPVTNDYSSFMGRETDLAFQVAMVGVFQATGLMMKVSRHGKS